MLLVANSSRRRHRRHLLDDILHRGHFLHGKVLAKSLKYLLDIHLAKIVEQSIRREYEQAIIHGVDEGDEPVSSGGNLGMLVHEFQRRLVPVMTIGNDALLVLHGIDKLGDLAFIRYPVQLLNATIIVSKSFRL